MTDRDLLEAYARGSERAFAEFYDRYRRELYVYLVALVGRRETAEELLQETFVAIVRSVKRIQLKPNMKPYLLTIARNAARDHQRRERRRASAITLLGEDPLFRRSASAEPSCALDADELSRALHELPDAQREAIVLRELVGMTYAEVAAFLDVPESTVVSRCRYAAQKLRQSLLQGGWSERSGHDA